MSSYLIPSINEEVYPQTRQRETQVRRMTVISELKREKSKIKTNQNTQQRKKTPKTTTNKKHEWCERSFYLCVVCIG